MMSAVSNTEVLDSRKTLKDTRKNTNAEPLRQYTRICISDSMVGWNG